MVDYCLVGTQLDAGKTSSHIRLKPTAHAKDNMKKDSGAWVLADASGILLIG